MSKLSIQNLGMIITNKCNLNCGHCLRGCKNNKDMKSEVIDATLKQIDGIGNLSICGGEPTMAIEVMEEIFRKVVEKKIVLNEVTTTINGTIYSEKFLELFYKIDDYVKCLYGSDKSLTNFAISYDKYHIEEMEKLGLLDKYMDNIKLYSESPYFAGLRTIPKRGILFKEGNAINLDKNITEEYKPIKIYVTYAGKHLKFDKDGLCNIGPLLTINPDGIITDCDASIENQETIYNYGNVLNDSIEEVALEKGMILKPRKWLRVSDREMKKHMKWR